MIVPLLTLLMVGTATAGKPEQRVVVGFHEQPPLIFTDRHGTTRGLAVDLLTTFAEKKAWRIHYLPGAYDQCITRLSRGTVDVVVGVVASAPPDERLTLGTEPIVADWGQLYVAADGRCVDLLTLTGKTIAVAASDPHGEVFAATLAGLGVRPRFATVDDYPGVLALIHARQADAGMVTRFFGAVHADGYDVKKSPIWVNAQALYFAIAGGRRPDLINDLDHHLQALKRQNEAMYGQALNRWALNGQGSPRPFWRRPLWIAGAVAGILGLIVVGNLWLTRQVRRRSEALQSTAVEKETIESELAVAREIQLQLVPSNFAAVSGRKEFAIYASLEPAREVGGDFYDFFFIDRDSLCLIVGDVSGKGVPAALFMAMTKTMLKSAARLLVEPETILADVNQEIARNNPSMTFVTVFLGVLDLNSGRLTYTSAGHVPQLFVGDKGNSVLLSDAQCPAIGLDETVQYRQAGVTLQHGEGLLLFTDGVTEAEGPEGRWFSQEALMNGLALTAGLSPRERITAILSQVREFTAGRPLEDDMTLMTLTYFAPSRVGDTLQTITLKNDIQEIDKINAAIARVADSIACPAVVAHDITLAIEEIFSNIVFYGFGDGLEHRITLQVNVEGDLLMLTLQDEGIPFNPLNVNAGGRDTPLEDRDKGGMGITLAKSLMDRMEYRRDRGRNILRMEKRFR